MLEFTDYMQIFIGLLAVIDPLGIVPIVVTITTGSQPENLKHIVNVVVITVLIILLITLYLGEYVLAFFGITINSFSVAGGVILMMMAIPMLHGKISGILQTEQEKTESKNKDSVAIVPLSMPLLAGPGAISAVILYAHRSPDLIHYFYVSLIIVLVVLILWTVLVCVPWLSKHLSLTGINVFTRLMGLVIAALAVEFIANGLRGLFPILAIKQ